MPCVRRSPDLKAVLLMTALCLVWGMQQAAIKLAAVDISPVLQVALRSGLAALLVGLYARIGRQQEPWLARISPAAMLGVGVLFATEFLFMALGLKLTSAAHMAVLIYTAPLFAALGLQFLLPEERLNGVQWCGVLAAFAGVAIAIAWPDASRPDTAQPWQQRLLGDLFGLGAGLAWGLTTVLIRSSRLSDAPATQTLFYQLTGAFVLLLPLALMLEPPRFTATTLSLGSLLFQGVIVSFVSYLAWFVLLRRYLAARLGVLVFMTPLFGIAASVVVLHEHAGAPFLAGSALALLGLLVVTSQGRTRPAPAATGASPCRPRARR